MRSPERAIILVTHYQRLLDYIVPDFVHVLSQGRIVKSGGKELALELEQRGYGWLEEAPTRKDRSRRANGDTMNTEHQRSLHWPISRASHASCPAHGVPWLTRAQPALGTFRAKRLSNLRDEEWKYTSVAAIEKQRFAFESRPYAVERWTAPCRADRKIARSP